MKVWMLTAFKVVDTHFSRESLSLELLYSYLQNLQKKVSINIVNSNVSSIGMDVPKGLSLGTMLLLDLIKDIFKTSSLLVFNLFADFTSA